MRRILLIDDEEGIRMAWGKWHDVQEETFRGQLSMETATSLIESEALIAKESFDVIILDLNLDIDGAEKSISWVANNHARLAPIVVLTGDEDIFIRRRCMMLGAAQFFTKTDAQAFPNLFFKILYNEYLKRYAATREASPV